MQMIEVTVKGEYVYREGKDRYTEEFEEKIELKKGPRGTMLVQARVIMEPKLKKKDRRYSHIRTLDFSDKVKHTEEYQEHLDTQSAPVPSDASNANTDEDYQVPEGYVDELAGDDPEPLDTVGSNKPAPAPKKQATAKKKKK